MILFQVRIGTEEKQRELNRHIAKFVAEVSNLGSFGRDASFAYFQEKFEKYYGSDLQDVPRVKERAEKFLAWIEKNQDLLGRFVQETREFDEYRGRRDVYTDPKKGGVNLGLPANAGQAQAFFEFWIGVKYAESELPKIEPDFYSGRALAGIATPERRENDIASNKFIGIAQAGKAYLLRSAAKGAKSPNYINLGIHERAHIADSEGRVSLGEGATAFAVMELGLERKLEPSAVGLANFYLYHRVAKEKIADKGLKVNLGYMTDVYVETAVYPWISEKIGTKAMAGALDEPRKGVSAILKGMVSDRKKDGGDGTVEERVKKMCRSLGIEDAEVERKLNGVFAELRREKMNDALLVDRFVLLMNAAFGDPKYGESHGYCLH